MSTAVARNIPLPSGYTIVDRLGAGGYGEVWKAIAPGGVEKAIKLVFGQCDEGIAERELKALERIRSVRHPFLLSIERYEIVEDRLVIVTELADMSLQDAFQRYRSEGQLGIPRKNLISYLWDAADALDCLVERHSLQHLDIKPENLLVVGDHVKVADFGLVKQLATQTLNSMIGGITPLYSPPEIFDDNPSARSDQYSLAIVYQQMLTGTLPFPGRTPAQLAKQHTMAVPNLRPLSDEDRPIVSKALAKDPSDRFTSCREFVSALRSLDHDSSSAKNHGSSSVCTGPALLDDTTPVAESDTALIDRPFVNAPTEAQRPQEGLGRQIQPARVDNSPVPFPSVIAEVKDVEVTCIELDSYAESVPTLFVGIGGVGVRMLRATRNRATDHESTSAESLAWLAIDTDRGSLTSGQENGISSDVDQEDLLHIPLRRPKQYRDSTQNLLRWVSRRWLYNIPRSLQTRGYRPLGRIAIVDHAEEILLALRRRLRKIATHSNTQKVNPSPLRVVLLGGMSGGTGSGTIVDLAQAVRSICQEFSVRVEVHAVLGCTFQPGGVDSLAAANMFALLKELNHVQSAGNRGESLLPGAAANYELPSQPFDEVYTLSIPKPGSSECESTLQTIADYLVLSSTSDIGKILDSIRSSTNDFGKSFSLRTLSSVDLEKTTRRFLHTCRQQLMQEVVEYWLEECSEDNAAITELPPELGKTRFVQKALTLLQRDLSNSYPLPNKEEPTDRNCCQKPDLKVIASALSDLQTAIQPMQMRSHASLAHAQIESISNQVVAGFAEYVREHRQKDLEPGQRLSELLFEEVTRSTEDPSEIDPAQLAAVALSQFPEGPLECGYQRRTLLVTPDNQEHSEMVAAFKELCPLLAEFRTTTSNAHLIREGAELSLLDMGARLAETYPDIEEAAGRLHTRSDILWRSLRGEEHRE